MKTIYAIILAAGKGTRMNSNHPKVIHKLLDKSMIECVSDSVKKSGIDEQIIVVGYKAEEIVEYLGEKAKYAYQLKQLGTGHAVMQAESLIENFDGYTLVLNGDAPLITEKTIQDTIDYHIKNQYACTVITSELEDPTGYGRIVRDENQNVIKIVEHKDTTDEQRKIKEVNSGLYCFTTKLLFEALKKVDNDNAQEEYYLTDTLEILRNDNHKIGAIMIEDNNEIKGVNSRSQLAELTKIMQKRVLDSLMLSGVTIIDPDTTYISANTKIGMDTIIYPGTIIEGNSHIGDECVIGPNTRIINSVIENGCIIQSSVINNSKITNKNTKPFSYIDNNKEV